MSDNLKKVMEFFTNNPAYLEKIEKINKEYPDIDENIDQLISLAAEAGFSITKDEFDYDKELTEEELAEVSGGRIIDHLGHTDCMCVVGGGGTKDELQKTCACVCYGMGLFTEEGKKKFGDRMAFCCPVMIGNA